MLLYFRMIVIHIKYIKRVITIEDDIIEIISNVVFVNNVEVEKNVNYDTKSDDFKKYNENYGPYVVPRGKYFLLGISSWDTLILLRFNRH